MESSAFPTLVGISTWLEARRKKVMRELILTMLLFLIVG
jgi:hypothetical protein